jgi:hypothetical protein
MPSSRRDQANLEAVGRMFSADPVVTGVERAGDVVPGLTENMILTSGPPHAPTEYTGGQRRGVLGAAVYEGLADDLDDAARKLESGEVLVEPCQAHGCVGSVAGIYSASMPVLVVENRDRGNRAFCNLYEGKSPRRLNYGVWDEEVATGLRYLEEVQAPVLDAAIRALGGVEIKPIIRRALNMGDELHSRNTAASLMFARTLFPALLDLADSQREGVDELLTFMIENEYFFLRLSMAAAKATADAAQGVEGSSLVTGMCLSGLAFAIRVSGLDDEWITGPMPTVRAKLFDGYTEDDLEWMGGESVMAEVTGLGGFAQAAAPALQAYQGGTVDAMIENNVRMYDITVAENPTFKVPYLGYRGTPTGVDIFAVRETGIVPVIDGGLGGKDGGQIGAGLLLAPIECFTAACDAYVERYGEVEAGVPA